MSEEIKQLFNQISPTYDKLNHLLSFNIDKRWRKKTIGSISAPHDAPIKALDLCAGTLDLSIEFLKQYPKAKLTAVDFSQSMLDAGKCKLSPEALERTEIICADALNLPFSDKSFDVLFCSYGFRNLSDKEKGLKEMARVVKPGGEVLILEFFKPEGLWTTLFHSTYGNVVLPLLGGAISKNLPAYRYLSKSIQSFLTVDQCCNLMSQNGYEAPIIESFFGGVTTLVKARVK